MTTAVAPAPAATLTETGHVIVYMPHSGFMHLALPENANPGFFGVTTPLCGGSIMYGAVVLAEAEAAYGRCGRCTKAAQA